jgi:hypothetical protein
MITGFFTQSEKQLINKVALKRQTESRKNNYNSDKRGVIKDINIVDTIGCAGELAVSKFLNIEWEQKVNDGKNPDVANYQVRATIYKNGKLILRDGDNLNEKYILVYVARDLSEYKICGWKIGSDVTKYGKSDFLNNPSRPSCWVLEQSKLNTMQSLNYNENYIININDVFDCSKYKKAHINLFTYAEKVLS